MSQSYDFNHEAMFLGVAHALYMNRLHILRLTEVVRLGISPNNEEDGNLEVPPELDRELQQQAVNYVMMVFPADFGPKIMAAKVQWMRLQ